MAAIDYFKDKAKKSGPALKIIELDGRPGVKEVSKELFQRLGI
jgi:hypothetical protein